MTNTLKLPARLDLAASQKLVADVSNADLSQTFTMDASEVSHLGALCAQAMIATARAAKEAGGALVLENVSDRVEGQLSTMGLSSETLMEGAQ